MALSEKLIDKRILRRSLEKGEVSEADFQDHLQSLPDRAGNLEQAAPAESSAATPTTPVAPEG